MTIDGSERSGSGTVLRHALVLATLFGEDVRITRIRAKRDKPGLRPQHLATVKACAELSRARVDGAHTGSSELVFRPGSKIAGGEYRWDIGTAGSTTMLAQALLPVAAFADAPTIFEVSGGVFQDFAPSPYHMRHVLFPILRKMGIEADLEIVRPGYVPAGNGLIRVTVEPLEGTASSLSMPEQGKASIVSGIAISSHLTEHRVSERMAEECKKALSERSLSVSIDITNDRGASQAGAGLAVWTETSAGCRLGSDQAGKRGGSSESIGRYVAESLLEDLDSGSTVDRFLADQLIIYAGLAKGLTEFVIPSLTDHVDSNLWLIEEFGARTRLDGRRLWIEGMGYGGRQRVARTVRVRPGRCRRLWGQR